MKFIMKGTPICLMCRESELVLHGVLSDEPGKHSVIVCLKPGEGTPVALGTRLFG